MYQVHVRGQIWVCIMSNVCIHVVRRVGTHVAVRRCTLCSFSFQINPDPVQHARNPAPRLLPPAHALFILQLSVCVCVLLPGDLHGLLMLTYICVPACSRERLLPPAHRLWLRLQQHQEHVSQPHLWCDG